MEAAIEGNWSSTAQEIPLEQHPLDFAEDDFIPPEEDTRKLEMDEFHQAMMESMQSGFVIPPANKTSSPTVKREPRPPPPYTVHLLFASQSHYEVGSACSVVCLFMVHYLVKSKFREADTIQWWIRLGCWFYKAKSNKLLEGQTANPHVHASFIAPKSAAKHFETLSTGLVYVEEIAGIIYDPQFVDATAPVSGSEVSVDHQFVKDRAFTPLWEAIRRLFFMALSEPVGATFLANEYTHAIGIRWNDDIPMDKRESLRRKLCPEGPDHYDGKSEPLLEELDEAVNFSQCFLVDLIDSHLNEGERGMSTDHIGKGSSIWIEFKRLSDLRDYLMERYPMKRDNEVSKDIYHKRENSFDMVVWRPSAKEHDPSDVNAVLQSPFFQRWYEDYDRLVKQMRLSSRFNHL